MLLSIVNNDNVFTQLLLIKEEHNATQERQLPLCWKLVTVTDNLK